MNKPHLIVWVNGPYRGSVHDLKIAKKLLVKKMKRGEMALADKGYVGHEKFLCPLKPPKNKEESLFNAKHYRVRQAIERLNKRLKHFSCLRQKWRQALWLHEFVFHVIAYITQIDLLYHPLTK